MSQQCGPNHCSFNFPIMVVEFAENAATEDVGGLGACQEGGGHPECQVALFNI